MRVLIVGKTLIRHVKFSNQITELSKDSFNINGKNMNVKIKFIGDLCAQNTVVG